jgi:CO/xanthine dehydrogenase FAD-binding subunit
LIAGYIKAENVSQALEALDSSQPMARILAGGTDLMQKTRATRQKKNNDIVFVDIKAIEELKGIRREGDDLIIGPAVTLDELMHHEMIAAYAPDLIKASGYVGSMELRNRATVGGNICTKNPAADLLVPLLALNARIEVADLNGRREMELAEVIDGRFKGFGRRTIITAIKVPAAETLITGYRRWTQKSMGRSYLTAMVVIQPAETGKLAVKIVMGGAGLWPGSFTEIVSPDTVKNIEKRKTFCQTLVQDKLGAAANDDTAYRKQLAWVLIYEALEIALKGVK